MRPLAVLTTCLVIAAVLFLATSFVWALGRAMDHEYRCASASGVCETP